MVSNFVPYMESSWVPRENIWNLVFRFLAALAALYLTLYTYNHGEPAYNRREPAYNCREPTYNRREPTYNRGEPVSL